MKPFNFYTSFNVLTQTILKDDNVTLDIKRLDQVHPFVSGNKFYKLKYNIEHALTQGYSRVLTFGGAYSNHIAATAYAARSANLKSIGIIRGEELEFQKFNHTLQFAHDLGMQLDFLSRADYKQRDHSVFIESIKIKYPNTYIIPEGGTNDLAIKGCQEILSEDEINNYEIVACPVGTGGTILGLIESSHPAINILGFSALKGSFLKEDIRQHTLKNNWLLTDDYCFGGYAKTTPELFEFIEMFESTYQIPIEPIYTAKMLFGIFELIKKNYFKSGTRILAIHTGGLQGKRSLMAR